MTPSHEHADAYFATSVHDEAYLGIPLVSMGVDEVEFALMVEVTLKGLPVEPQVVAPRMENSVEVMAGGKAFVYVVKSMEVVIVVLHVGTNGLV